MIKNIMSFIHDDEYIIIVDYARTFNKEMLSQFRDIGIKTVITYFGWYEGEPKPEEYDFEPIHKYMQMANQVGMKVLLMGGYGSPFWAPQNWFFKDQNGKYNDHEDLIKNFDFSDNMNRYIMTERIVSYWCNEALQTFNKFLYKMGEELHQENLFFSCPTGIGNEYFQTTSDPIRFYWYDDYALDSYEKYLRIKYNDNLDKYNFCHSSTYKDFKEIKPEFMRGRNYCFDTVEWFHSAIINKLIVDVSILKKFNPVNEQFSCSVLYPWANYSNTFWSGITDPLALWEFARKKTNIEFMNEIRWFLHPNTNFKENTDGEHETVWQTHKYGYKLWSGAEGPENIVNNTSKALKFGQRGFVCGKVDWNNIEDWELDEIKKSLQLWKKYRGE